MCLLSMSIAFIVICNVKKKTNMKKKLFISATVLFISIIAFGQKQEKFFYDSDWKGCSQSKAEFYRIVTLDANGKPVGKVMDYFSTGEVQAIADGAILIDRDNDENSIFTGNVIGYYKNGNKRFENLLSEKGTPLRIRNYHENGQLKEEGTYNDKRKMHGNYNLYYQSGKLYQSFQFSNGELASKFFIECDEFGSCQKVFNESFLVQENINEWQLISGEQDQKSAIIPKKGLLMETKKEKGFSQTINIPLSLSEDFSIETIIDYKSGEKNSGHGLIWGFKDWQNYHYFYISANGYYQLGVISQGIILEFVKWTQTSSINIDYARNRLKVLKLNDKMYYSINGKLVNSEDFYLFRGNNIGFSILSGKKEVLFENLIVKQDVEAGFVPDNSANSIADGWKGNGTGFFISANGYIATNYHVISESSEIEIEFIRNGQKQNFNAKIVQCDKQNDLAILKIDDNSFRPFNNIPYNFQTSLAEVGSNVFALGFPMALTVMGTEIKFTDGKISSKTGFQGDISTYQMTTPIQPGNSGGPLFDFDGNLIGINSAKIRSDIADNVSYAIKTSYLKNLIDVLPITLNLPSDKTTMNKTLTEKIKIISDYVVLIRIK